jgi:HPt (histidine-containing phosphotransfer) domain-containing protein
MDCQMPVMNGYEATKEIRSIENSLKANKNIDKHVPIIALTANVVEDAENECLNSGMDDYLTKPIDTNKLVETVNKYLKQEPADKFDNSDNIAKDEVINSASQISEIIKAIVNDHGFTEDDAEEFLNEYLSILPDNISALKNAIDRTDFNSVISIAHTLKGSSGNLRMNTLMKIATELEQAGKVADESLCRKLIANIENYTNSLH